VPKVLKRFSARFSLISVQDVGLVGTSEYLFQLFIRDSSRNEEMVSALSAVSGLTNINLTMQEELLEV